MEIIFALAISLVLMLVMMAVVLVVGASFVELVISLLIPFVLCAAGAAALFGVLFLLSKVLPISKKLKSTVQMIIILVAIVVVPISYFLYTFLPMQGHCFDISKTEQVICYDRLGPDKDVWMKDDFRNGRLTKDYPSSIANDSDTKAFYGAIVTVLRPLSAITLSENNENTIAEYARKITKAVSDHAKRDWKHNEIVHKQIHRVLDDCLFEMFDNLGYVIDNSNIDMLDLTIDEIMKVAVARY